MIPNEPLRAYYEGAYIKIGTGASQGDREISGLSAALKSVADRLLYLVADTGEKLSAGGPPSDLYEDLSARLLALAGELKGVEVASGPPHYELIPAEDLDITGMLSTGGTLADWSEPDERD